jgi:hypothetical protein
LARHLSANAEPKAHACGSFFLSLTFQSVTFFLTVRSSVLAYAVLLTLLQDATTLCEATKHMTWKFNAEVDNKAACHRGALGKPLNIFTGQ